MLRKKTRLEELLRPKTIYMPKKKTFGLELNITKSQNKKIVTIIPYYGRKPSVRAPVKLYQASN